jgi:hypothetical protein
MKEVFVHRDPTRVGLYKSVLEEAGIPCFIRDEYGSTSLASRKSTFFSPALCVLNDEDEERAKGILADIENAPVTEERDWTCPSCQESVPANFGSCWKCGVLRLGIGVPED